MDIHTVSQLEEFLQDVLAQSDGQQVAVFCDPSKSWLTNAHAHDSSPAIFPALEDCSIQRPKNWTILTSLNHHMQEARVLKSESEADLMRYACAISAAAFNKVMAQTQPGMNERQLWAMMDYECVFNGADRLAFPPVVASGPRYTSNLTFQFSMSINRSKVFYVQQLYFFVAEQLQFTT